LADGFQTRQIDIDHHDVVLSGLGGVGKTQMAAAYAHHAWAGRAVDLLVWVTASDRQTIIAGYAHAAADILAADERDAERAAGRFLAWLAGTDHRWLIVLDDLATPADLTGLWPATTDTGTVLVTTRRRDAALATTGRRLVTIGLFNPEEARTYLQYKLGTDPPRLGQADDLAADLGYLPLALAQAVAYILDRGLDCATYRHRLTDRRRRLDDVLPEPDALPDEHQATVAATWSLSIGAADHLSPAGLAHPLLNLAAVLDPNGVPAAVLTAPPVLAHLTAASGGRPVSVDDATDALHNLHRLSLITLNRDDPVRSVLMHALTQRSTRERLPAHALAALLYTAADALVETWPALEREPGFGAAMRANAAALRQHDPDALLRRGVHPVMFRLGSSLGEAGLTADAITHVQTLIDDCERMLGADHPDSLSARYDLAYWQGELGDFAGAVTAQERLVADRLRVLGPDHPDTLGTRANLAYWRGHAGDPAAAVVAFAQVLADQIYVLGPDHPNTLSTRHNLAHCRGQAGDPAAAARATEELLADSLRIHGPDHYDTLDTRRNLAYWRGQAGDPAGAMTALAPVLDGYLRLLGPEHPDTLHTRDNLAHLRGSAGDPAGAADAYEQLLADRLRVLGPEHRNTLTTRQNLAHWLACAGDLAGAIAAYEEVLADQVRILGPDHPYSLRTRFDVASWLGLARGAAEAIDILGPLLADTQRALGPDHSLVLDTRHQIASWQARAGDPAAVHAFNQLLADQVRILGPDHPQTTRTRANLAPSRSQLTDVQTAVQSQIPDRSRRDDRPGEPTSAR
jgi:tetratricopeptide (TPR) repeat protein